MKKPIILIIIAVILIAMSQLKFPLDKTDKNIIEKAIDSFLQDKIFDLEWSNFYHYSTWFESVDGYEVQSGTVANDGGVGVLLTTGIVNGNTAEMIKDPETQNLLRWDKNQRFRASFFVNATTTQTVKVCIGEETPAVGAVQTGYGFKVTNAALKGISANGTSETEIDLGVTLSAAAGVDVEARFVPGKKIIFLVNKVERGLITDNLPSLDSTPLHNNFINVWIKTNDAVARSMEITYFEYIQKR